MNITTAHDALADGIHPGELFRAARWNENFGKPNEAAALRKVGRELASLMGLQVRSRSARNDNYRKRRAA